MNRPRNTSGFFFAVLCALAISAVAGQIDLARAQFNESQEFFDDGDREFEQQAETLEEPQSSEGTPLLTVEEEPAESDVERSNTSEPANLLPTQGVTGNEE